MMNIPGKVLIRGVLSLLLCLAITAGVGGYQPTAAEGDFSSSYDNLKSQYPEYIQKMVNGGASEAQIEAFLTDLDNEVQSSETLTEANFNSVLYGAIKKLLMEDKHQAILGALLNSFAEEITYFMTTGSLHPNMLPLRNAVRDSVLNSGSDNHSSGTSSGSSSNSDSSTNEQEEEILTQLSQGKSVITIDLEDAGDNGIEISQSVLKKISSAGRDLIITADDVSLKIPSNAINISTGCNLYLDVDTLSQSRSSDLLARVQPGQKVIGQIYSLKASSDESIRELRLASPMTVKISYRNADLQGCAENTLGIAYYDESRKNWQQVTSTLDSTQKLISFSTVHFYKYAVMSFSPVAQPAPSSVFSDLAQHWAAGNINQLVASGAVKGYPDNTFRPDGTITRAEFITILVKAFKLDTREGKVFNDTASHWARDYISAASAYNIVSGLSEDQFGPDQLITREQMAVMLVKAAKLPLTGQGRDFIDSKSISVWAKDYINTATDANIISGYPNNTFRPKGNATRAEAATVIMKAIK